MPVSRAKRGCPRGRLLSAAARHGSTQHSGSLSKLLTEGKKSDTKSCPLSDPIYWTLWKRQAYRDRGNWGEPGGRQGAGPGTGSSGPPHTRRTPPRGSGTACGCFSATWRRPRCHSCDHVTSGEALARSPLLAFTCRLHQGPRAARILGAGSARLEAHPQAGPEFYGHELSSDDCHARLRSPDPEVPG